VRGRVGLELRRIREERGLTVEELAQKSGVSVTTIRVAERGPREPSDDTVARLARPLGLTFEEVWGLQRRGGSVRAYSRSSARTPSGPANLRAVLGLAMRRSSPKSEMESADTPLLAESSWRLIPRSFRTLFSRCSRGMGGPYPAIRRAERESYGRTDNWGRARPETAAVFRGPSLTGNIGYTKTSERSTDVVDEHARSEKTEPESERRYEARREVPEVTARTKSGMAPPRSTREG
jgi:transcriptional regulator with XRE-family HTH domain